jgi:DHA1 family bicyclomycin/chloramphenicol resistance-like MFS transporter
MLGTGFLISNAMALALDPLPKIAGLAASIIGSLQNFGSSIGSIATGFIYNGSIRNVILLMGLCGLLTVLIFIFGAKTTNRLSINNS